MDDDSTNQLDLIIASIVQEYHLQVASSFIESKIKQMFDTVNNFNAEELKSTLKSSLGVDVFASEPYLNNMKDLWVKQNVSLITNVEDQYFSRVEDIISTGVRSGTMTSDISQQISDQTGVSSRRAQLIARDQVGTLNGQLTKQRQTNIGIDEYIWSTSHDKRVRPLHKPRDGQRFSWDNPPSDGHPGMPISCRCVALPVIDTDKISVMGVK